MKYLKLKQHNSLTAMQGVFTPLFTCILCHNQHVELRQLSSYEWYMYVVCIYRCTYVTLNICPKSEQNFRRCDNYMFHILFNGTFATVVGCWWYNLTSVNFIEMFASHITHILELLPNTNVKNIESCDLYMSFLMLVICVWCWCRLFYTIQSRICWRIVRSYLSISARWMDVTLNVAMVNKRTLSHFKLLHENLIGIFYAIQFQFSTYDNAPIGHTFSTDKKSMEIFLESQDPFYEISWRNGERGFYACEIVLVENEWNMGQL